MFCLCSVYAPSIIMNVSYIPYKSSRMNLPRRRSSSYQLKKLKEIHHAVARGAVMNKSNKQIAEELGVTPAMVSYTKRDRQVREKIRALRAVLDADAIDVAARMQELAPLALHKLESILVESNDDKEIRQTAFGLLDRAGFVAKQHHVVEHLTKEELQEIKLAAVAAGAVIEEAEFTEIKEE